VTASTTAAISLASLIKDLVNEGIISTKDGARARGGSTTQHPISALSRMELVDLRSPDRKLTSVSMSQWLAERFNLPYFSINPLLVDVDKTTEVMSYAFAKSHQILCVEASTKEVVIATSRPDRKDWMTSIEQMTRRKVKLVIAAPDEIERYLVEFYSIAKSVSGAQTAGTARANPVTNFEQLMDMAVTGDGHEDKHVVNIVDWLLQYAFSQAASDIHIEPRRVSGTVRFRIDGILHDVYEMPSQVTSAVVSRLKILGRMDVAEKRRPQDGRIKTRAPKGGEVELRLSTLATAFGEKLVLRIFDPEVLIRSLADMGFEPDQQETWESLLHENGGILLVTGPTGSGKTTTLYSSLKKLASREVNLCTLEDPIEMVVDQFNQTQVQTGVGLGFSAGIRTLLRQDPDIIMVGEIRDKETAEMAMQAALTGHLVLSTLHTNDAISAISRLLDLGLPAHLIRVTLKGVLAQRLVRRLCTSCREKIPVDTAAWKALAGANMPAPAHSFAARGCLECRNTGYRGRVGIYEMLVPSKNLRRQIAENVDVAALRSASDDPGWRSLRLSGAMKVARGETTVEEIYRVTPDSGEE
jgi:general secretion pathway protein E